MVRGCHVVVVVAEWSNEYLNAAKLGKVQIAEQEKFAPALSTSLSRPLSLPCFSQLVFTPS